MFPHQLSDLFEVRIERRTERRSLKIAGGYFHSCEVDIERQRQRFDRTQIAVADRSGKRVFIGDGFKQFAEIAFVAPVGGCGYSEQPGVGEVIDNATVTCADGVVRLIYDDGIEVVARETVQPFLALQGLDAPDHYVIPTVKAAGLRFFKRASQTDRPFQFVGSLIQQFFAVGENEYPVALPYPFRDHVGEYDGFSCAGRQDQQGFANPRIPRLQYGVLRLYLIRS